MIRLFEKQRDSIYQAASACINDFKAHPHFLSSLFTKLTKLQGNDYAQQQILYLIDELIAEQNLDDEEEELMNAEYLEAEEEETQANQAQYRNHVHVNSS